MSLNPLSILRITNSCKNLIIKRKALYYNYVNQIRVQFSSVNMLSNKELSSFSNSNTKSNSHLLTNLKSRIDFKSICKQKNLFKNDNFMLEDLELIFEKLILFKVIPVILTRDNLTNHILDIFKTNLLHTNNKGLAKPLLANHQNWSIFLDCFQALKDLELSQINLQENDKKILMSHQIKSYVLENFQVDHFNFHIMKALHLFQEQKLDEFIRTLSVNEKVNDDQFECFQTLQNLNQSLFKFIQDLNVIEKWKNDEMAISFYLDSLKMDINFLKALTIKHKKTLFDLFKEEISEAKENYALFNTKMKQLKCKFANIEKMPASIKINLLEIMIFDKENFFKQVDLTSSLPFNYLIEQPHSKILKTALEGAIHQNDIKNFKAYAEKLFILNCSNIVSKIDFRYASIFKQFLLLRLNADLDESLLGLFEAWESFHYMPNESIIMNLKNFIEYNKTSSTQWKAYQVNITTDGKCSNGTMVKPIKYSHKDLNSFAEYMKNHFNNKNTRFLFDEALIKLEDILRENKFDFIIDGLNIGFNKNLSFSYNFHRLFKCLELDKKYLITLRYNFYKNEQAYFDELKDVVDCKFLFTDRLIDDDFFVIYAALKNDAFIVSNDDFTNYVSSFGNFSYIFNNWLKSKLVKRKAEVNFSLIYPENFYHFVQKTNENQWIIPYYSFLNQPVNFELPNKFLCVEK